MTDRGNYIPINDRGLPVVYERGDEVSHGGGTFRAIKRNTYLDGEPGVGDSWERLTQSFVHSNGNNPHANPNIGDEWYDKNTGILFKFLDDGNSKQWVEVN